MAELKPCPFCGGEPCTYFSGSKIKGTFAEIICKGCKSQTDRLLEAKAIEAWNRRAEDGKAD